MKAVVRKSTVELAVLVEVPSAVVSHTTVVAWVGSSPAVQKVVEAPAPAEEQLGKKTAEVGRMVGGRHRGVVLQEAGARAGM